MKKHLLALSAAAVLLAPQAVGAEGFAINEWSAEGVAMGGARMFAENDAANFAYNPASMTKVQGEKIKVSATYLSPHGKYKAASRTNGTGEFDEYGRNRIHPGWAPGSYYVKQISDNEWVGLGAYSRFGMICQFERDSLPGTNAFSSRLNGLSIGMNYAKKLNKKWSASVGAEINYVGLQLDKNLDASVAMGAVAGGSDTKEPLKTLAEQLASKYDGTDSKGDTPLHIEGTSWALGWNAAVNYEFDDKNEMGVVYRSKVKHSMEADYDVHGLGADFNAAMHESNKGDAYGVVTLPESVAIGYGHKFDDKTRMELNATWTRWSRFDSFWVDVNPNILGYPQIGGEKNWDDGWRYAIGVEHKLSDKYSLLAGFAYDEGSIPDETADFMVPTGDRTTYTIGAQYHDKKQTVALTLGYMDVGGLKMGPGTTNGYSRAEMYDSYTKMVSISYQRNF